MISFSIGLKSAAIAALICADSSSGASGIAALRLSWGDGLLITFVFASAAVAAYVSARWLEGFLSPPPRR
jgi:hypothetical protein